MDHPFEHRAHYNPWGDVCHCPWGFDPGGEHLGAVKEASKLEWLEGRPDMQSPEGEKFLNFVKGVHGIHYDREADFSNAADKMLPWIAREWRKKRLEIPGKADPYALLGFKYQNHRGQTRVFNPGTASEAQQSLEEMKKRGQGIDLMQHKVHELVPKIQDFKDWKQAQARQDLGEPLHKFDDGWTVRRLQNAAEHEDEGQEMGHCIGGRGYANETESGGYPNMYVSLRDHKNLPHASMQISPDHWRHPETGETASDPLPGYVPQIGPSSRVGEFYGKEDRAPEPEYESRMNKWLTSHGAQPTEEGDPEDAEYEVPGAHTVEEYNQGQDGNYLDWAYEDPEANIGENTDIYQGPHEWDSIVNNLLGYKPARGRGQNLERSVNPEAMQDFFHAVHREDHIPYFEQALHGAAEEHPNTYPEVADAWEKYKEPYYDPYTGELGNGWSAPPIQKYQPKLFAGPLDPNLTRPNPPPANGNWDPVQGPHLNPYRYWPDNVDNDYRYTSASKPLYYRWVFSPTKGVTLGTNNDNHPALIDYHQNLGGQINDTDLTHGYAYPIGNGWRVTDYEHQPVSDPYIVNAVVRRLNLGADPQMSAEGSWRPAEYDFDRIHYGLPREKTGSF